jgi:NADPH-dependent glutamate synthase beta subunit-like oxidoreductase/Pyruvate/2-oxoacid:ferredoxin oxidoreductase delta subunit
MGKQDPFTSITYQSTLINRTGTWRTQRPVFKNRLSPCKFACPAENNIPEWIDLLRRGEFRRAWEVILETNPLPFVCGEVCPHPCEDSCNRSQFDESLSIRALERFLGQEALKKDWRLPKRVNSTGAKVAIIGSGPAGLSCAYQLGRQGYQATIFEALPDIGGLLRTGIPDYRLQKDNTEKEIMNNILSPFQIEVRTSTPVNKEIFQEIKKEFQAIFVAVGAHRSKRLDIPGEGVKGVLTGLDFLKMVNFGQDPGIGKRVAIMGGGNTAIDAALCAHDKGAEVLLIYRRTREDMPAFEEEIREAERKGIEFYFLTRPSRILSENGYVKRIECQKGEIKGKDDEGRSKVYFPEESPQMEIEVNNVVTAIGEEPSDLSFVDQESDSVFIGGDARALVGMVSAAIGSGREAAEKIHFHLTNQRITTEDMPESNIVQFGELNLDYFEHRARQTQFPDSQSVMKEAERCFSCGNCNMCGNCWLFCPDMAIRNKETGYEIDCDYCKGCMICVEECPTKAMSFIKEEQ